jgi:hypothetical protein
MILLGKSGAARPERRRTLPNLFQVIISLRNFDYISSSNILAHFPNQRSTLLQRSHPYTTLLVHHGRHNSPTPQRHGAFDFTRAPGLNPEVFHHLENAVIVILSRQFDPKFGVAKESSISSFIFSKIAAATPEILCYNETATFRCENFV